MGLDKAIKYTDLKIAQRVGLCVRPLSAKNVEKYLEDCGLDREFGTYCRMSALSRGQKIKVILVESMWNQPHILILDEPTNYLDREARSKYYILVSFIGRCIQIISLVSKNKNQLC